MQDCKYFFPSAGNIYSLYNLIIINIKMTRNNAEDKFKVSRMFFAAVIITESKIRFRFAPKLHPQLKSLAFIAPQSALIPHQVCKP